MLSLMWQEDPEAQARLAAIDDGPSAPAAQALTDLQQARCLQSLPAGSQQARY